ncbi:MAG: hypothetical protein GY731_04645, partial [Gammaproteobacteria bacterium]|nr:hypothetical protein [Gammaproteobacteria bacterium]
GEFSHVVAQHVAGLLVDAPRRSEFLIDIAANPTVLRALAGEDVDDALAVF